MIRVRVKKTYPQFEGFMELGEELTLVPVLRPKDEPVHGDIYGSFKDGNLIMLGGKPKYGKERIKKFEQKVEEGSIQLVFPKLVREKGSVKAFNLTFDDGRIFGDHVLTSLVGPRLGLFSNLFERLNVKILA